LSALRRRRSWARRATAGATLLAAMLGMLGTVFLVDFAFALDVAQRLVVLALAAVAYFWTVRRHVAPYCGIRESEIDLALQVEQRESIDNDLVAAIQFERPAAVQWGSQQLQAAVMHRAAAVERQADFLVDVAPAAMRRRLGLLAAALLVSAGVGLTWPDHVRVFARRLLLASVHYPSATAIEEIALDNRVVLIRSRHGTQPEDISRPEGRPIRFSVAAGGRLPKAGYVTLRTQDGRQRRLELLPSQDAGQGASVAEPGDARRRYLAHLPRLVEPISYQVHLGDAWSDPARVRMVPLPIVELRLTAIPPAYARQADADAAADPFRRQLSALEGSEVRVGLESTNGKSLESARLMLTNVEPSRAWSLARKDRAGLRWQLPAADTPFLRLERELRFEVQVVDQDGLRLETPLRGYVRIRPDRPPTCTASVVHRVVLPTAAPVVEYRANDDCALSAVRLCGKIERGPGSEKAGRSEGFSIPLVELAGPILTDRLPVSGRYRLDLAALPERASSDPATYRLAKGDRLELRVEAVDYRGATAGQVCRSEPIVLEISDESGVLTAISEADKKSEERLGEIIKRQLGISAD
jgi:hypothetical protein